MVRELYYVRETTVRLTTIQDELCLWDFIVEHLGPEFSAIIVQKEKEQANNKQSIFPVPSSYDFRRFGLFLLKRKLSSDLSVNILYSWTAVLKVLLFYEYVLTLLPQRNQESAEANKKIRGTKKVFELFKILIGDSVCSLAMHEQAVRTANMQRVQQSDLDHDTYRIFHDRMARVLLDDHLVPFMESYPDLISAHALG